MGAGGEIGGHQSGLSASRGSGARGFPKPGVARRGVAEIIVKPMGLLVAGFNFGGVAEDEFNEWYNTEHIPRLAGVPGCLSARRFKTGSGRHQYIALYHLTSPEVVASKTWEEAASTPWTLKLRPYTSDRLRLVLRRYAR